MEQSAYNLLRDNIHDFKTVAAHVESEIERYGIRDNSFDPIPGMNRRHHDMWVSMKTVSHFNLGVALELLLKWLLICNKIDVPREHSLTTLYDALPQQCQQLLESTYLESTRVLPDGQSTMIAFINTASPERPSEDPPNRELGTLRHLFEYFDEDVMVSVKRYSYEAVEKRVYRHYLSTLADFFAFIDRVTAQMTTERPQR